MTRMSRRKIECLVDELFNEVQLAQGYAFCSDGEIFETEEELFDRIRGRLKWNDEASRIMREWLRKHGQMRQSASKRRSP